MMRQIQRIVAAAAIAVAAAAPAVAAAEELSNQFTYGASIYGWLPDIRGHTSFPANGGSSISVDASQILDNLKFVGMGTLSVQKDRWGAFSDFIYLNVGGSKSGTRDLTVGGITLPGGITADANLDIKSSIWTLAGSYRLIADPTTTFDVFAGARQIQLKENLNWTFSADIGGISPPPRTGSNSQKINNIDGIVGAKGRYAFGANHEWYVPYYVDIGTGDSDLTWQAIGGIGYTFNWGEVFAVWRYLDYNFKNQTIEDVNFSGPAIGVAFHW
jgi:hypothetical protein